MKKIRKKANGNAAKSKTPLKIMVSMPNTLPFIHTAAHLSMMDIMSPPALAKVTEVLGTSEWMYTIDRQGGYPMHFNRNNSCRAVLDSGADFWLTFDSDMVFPQTVIADLLRVMTQGDEMYDPETKRVRKVSPGEIDILSGLYFKKAPPFPPINGVFTRDDLRYWHSPINTEYKGLVRNDVIGAGCMCVRPDALRKMDAPWFQYQEIVTLDGHHDLSSEDVWFCMRAQDCGLQVWTDTRMVCGHITGFSADQRHWDQFKNGTPESPGLFDPKDGHLRMELLDEDTGRHFVRNPNAWPGTGPR